MANDDNEKWSLPAVLDINKNPAVREQAAELRKQLEPRAVSPFARLSPQEFARIRARNRIPHLTSALQQVEQEIKVNRGVVYGRQLQEARDALRARLAENLAILQNFALAAEIHPDPRYRQEYAKQFRKEVTS
jgi:broad specificity phosphatase PhoE